MTEDAATAATGVASAAYFLGRALRLKRHRDRSERRRRFAALLLAALFLGAALDSLEQIAAAEGGVAHALVRAPLLLACAGAALVVIGSARR
jgi:hypothetical protein